MHEDDLSQHEPTNGGRPIAYTLVGGPFDGIEIRVPCDCIKLVIEEPNSKQRHRYEGYDLATSGSGPGTYREYLVVKYQGIEE